MNKKKYLKSIFLFCSDLRFHDNTALITALKNSELVIPVFIKENLDLFKAKNKNNQQFIVESLEVLNTKLVSLKTKLFVINKIQDLNKLIVQDKDINSIFINKLYHPKHVVQEIKIEKICKTKKVDFNIFHDYLLHEVNSVVPVGKKSFESYKVYTPFFRQVQKLEVRKPIVNKYKNFVTKDYKIIDSIDLTKLSDSLNFNKKINLSGGFVLANKILKNLKNYKDYKKIKDFPALDGTTKLSAYINTGCVSIRQIYYDIVKALGKNHELIRQLYWREFYYNLYYAYPELFKTTLKKPKIKWVYNKAIFNKWKNSKTGIPIIDASMRQLNITGFMNNRCRMIVSNFLALKLKINWVLGEKYFAKFLTDYDPILNNGNWQYMAQVGADTAGYLRILNPILQQKKFDPKKEFITFSKLF